MQPRRRSREVAGALAMGALMLCACPETRFVDPNAPDLVKVQGSYTPSLTSEPRVFVVLLDLQIPDAAQCQATENRLVEEIRDALLPPGEPGASLTPQELSPNCEQQADRGFDVDAYEQQVAVQENAFGRVHVRPILVYVNNVDLPLPTRFKQDLIDIRTSARERSAPLPLLWGVALPRALGDTTFDSSTQWTYSTDPALLEPLRTNAAHDLPLATLTGTPPEGVPLLTDSQLGTTVELKVCSYGSGFQGKNFTMPGPVPVLRSQPPRYLVTFPAATPMPRSQLTPAPIQYELELCRGNCDHFTDSPLLGLTRWSSTSICLL